MIILPHLFIFTQVVLKVGKLALDCFLPGLEQQGMDV